MSIHKKTGRYLRLAAALVLLLGISTTVLAETKGKIATGGGEGGSQLPIAKVTVEKKTLGALITNIGDRYAVSDATIIADAKGKQVSIRQLLVPCEVEMTFITEGGVRKADYVKIIQIGRNPTWQWISEKPE